MPKMTKHQRDVLRTATFKAAVTALNKKYADLLSDWSMRFRYCSWGEGCIDITTTSVGATPTPIKVLTEQLIKKRSIQVVVDNTGDCCIHKSDSAKKILSKLKSKKDVLYAAKTAINAAMDTEFVLKTSFTDIDDISQFISDFVKTLTSKCNVQP